MDDPPQLYLVATPIGNLEDMTFRAVRVLKEVAAIACEDTRVTRKLFNHFDIHPSQVFACHDRNELNSAHGIIQLLEKGKSVALCTDAGMPAVSDPGYLVVRTVLDAGHTVTAIPGASAVLTALTVSGLATTRFVFIGFGPRKPGKRRRWLSTLAEDPATIVLMESPHRLPQLLVDALEVLGDRQAAVTIELTKKFETIERGTLSELIKRFPNAPRGEVTIVIDGAATEREKRRAARLLTA